MIMPRSADLMHQGLIRSQRLRWVHVDVCDSARMLSQNHLCGPTAGLVLAEALAGVALLGSELNAHDETVSLRLQVTGPLDGLLVEAAGNGALRGYTRVKVMNELDGQETLHADWALGSRAEVWIVSSKPGVILSQAALAVEPATIQGAIETYYTRSLQRRVFVMISCQTYDGWVDLARALLVECMPDGNRQAYERLKSLADEGAMLDAIESASGVEAFWREMGVDDAVHDNPTPLRFACRCNRQRVGEMLKSLPRQELEQMAAAGKPVNLFCHMCGKSYPIDVATLTHLLAAQRQGGDSEEGSSNDAS